MTRAIIAGGGIGGLTAALCLKQSGWDVCVLEQSPELAEVGAGLQISPNGMKVLRALDLEQKVIDAAFVPDGIELRLGGSGRTIFNVPMKQQAVTRWGASYVQIHRADLLNILAEALEQRAPGAINTGSPISSYRQKATGVSVILDDGREVPGDILIGADGIHSVIRTQMQGGDRPLFTGNVAWRMVVPTDRLDEGFMPPPTGCAWVGSGRHAVTYKIRQGKLINLVGIVERDDWLHEGWNLTGTKEEALADFADFHPTIKHLIDKADVYHRWALHDRLPLDGWCDGRVTLLGDACHPMLPFLAQGAVMAMEDAYVLARCLSQDDDVVQALLAYQNSRLKRTARVQAGARANMGIFHRRTLISQLATYGPMKLAATFVPSIVRMKMDWLYGHDVTENR